MAGNPISTRGDARNMPKRKYIAQPDPGPIDGTDLVMRRRAAERGSAALLKAILTHYANRQATLKT